RLRTIRRFARRPPRPCLRPPRRPAARPLPPRHRHPLMRRRRARAALCPPRVPPTLTAHFTEHTSEPQGDDMPRTLSILVAALAAAVLPAGAARAQSADAAPAVHRSQHHEFRVVTVADGLQHPWSIAFLPGGDMLVTERPGRLRVVRNGVLQPEPIEGVPAVRARGQGGLLDVVPHPDFASNRLLYLTYSKPNEDGSQGTTAVARGRLEGNRLVDVQDIFVAKAWSTGGKHVGSRLAFDGRGHIFFSVGDRAAPPVRATVEQHPAQDPSNHQGTIIRLNEDGSVPADNPFVNREGVLPEIWSYGHRNPQGLAIHPETGDVWANEHGPRGGDELNLVRPG